MTQSSDAALAINGGEKAAASLEIPSWPQLTSGARENLTACLESTHWCKQYEEATYVETFEDAFATYHDAEHAIGVTNGTTAIQVALRAVGIRPGDEVLVTPYTWVSTAMAIVLEGGIPRFVDVDPTTYNIDPDAIRAAVTEDTAGIIGVHVGGYPMDLDELVPIYRDHNLFFIEDCAHAQGTEWRGRKVGTFGHVGTFSFQQSKSLTAGEGGAIITNDDRIAEMGRTVHWMGRDPGGKLGHIRNASNHRMSEFLGAVLLGQLDELDDQNARRQANEAILREELEAIDGIEMKPRDDRITNRGYFCVNVKYDREAFAGIDRRTFVNALQAEGVPVNLGVHGGEPLYRQPSFTREQLSAHLSDVSDLPNYGTMHLPGVEELSRRNVTFTHQTLLADAAGIRSIGDAIRKIQERAEELREAE